VLIFKDVVTEKQDRNAINFENLLQWSAHKSKNSANTDSSLSLFNVFVPASHVVSGQSIDSGPEIQTKERTKAQIVHYWIRNW